MCVCVLYKQLNHVVGDTFTQATVADDEGKGENSRFTEILLLLLLLMNVVGRESCVHYGRHKSNVVTHNYVCISGDCSSNRTQRASCCRRCKLEYPELLTRRINGIKKNKIAKKRAFVVNNTDRQFARQRKEKEKVRLNRLSKLNLQSSQAEPKWKKW